MTVAARSTDGRKLIQLIGCGNVQKRWLLGKAENGFGIAVENHTVGKLIEAVDLAGSEVLKRFVKIQNGKDTPRANANRELAKLKKGAA